MTTLAELQRWAAAVGCQVRVFRPRYSWEATTYGLLDDHGESFFRTRAGLERRLIELTAYAHAGDQP